MFGSEESVIIESTTPDRKEKLLRRINFRVAIQYRLFISNWEERRIKLSKQLLTGITYVHVVL